MLIILTYLLIALYYFLSFSCSGTPWGQGFWSNFFLIEVFLDHNRLSTLSDEWMNEWIEERGKEEKSLRVQGCFGPALRLKINTEKLRKMDNDRVCVHLLIILKSVIIKDRHVDWQLATVGIDAPNLRWLEDQNLMSMKGCKWLGASLSDSYSSVWRQSAVSLICWLLIAGNIHL